MTCGMGVLKIELVMVPSLPSLPPHPLHRQGISSELSEGAACQLDKLHGLLKDPPNKYTLKTGDLRFSPTPALDVVHDPTIESHINILSVSEEAELGGGIERFRGYAPGPNQSQSLKRDCNTIPRYGRGVVGCNGDKKVGEIHTKDFR